MAEPRASKQSRALGSQRKTRPVPTSSRPLDVTRVTEWKDGSVSQGDDYLVGEEPLEIRIGARPISVTMRTPGHDLELAAGFLLTEGVINGSDQIAGLRQAATRGQKRNVVRVDLQAGVAIDTARLQRNFAATSSCGLCGKASIDAVRVRGIARPNPDLRVAPDILCLLPDVAAVRPNPVRPNWWAHAAGLFDTMGQAGRATGGRGTAQCRG